MIKGGTGGANTNLAGLRFEAKTNLADALMAAGYGIEGNRVSRDSDLFCLLVGKHDLYRFLLTKGVDYLDHMSNKMLPDECAYFPSSNHFLIVEKKWQEIGGSVDEKLAACDFKLKRYRRLFSPLDARVTMVYVLNDYFQQKRYEDVFEYMQMSGCQVYFEELPLEVLSACSIRKKDS